jgi:hypothetical protein
MQCSYSSSSRYKHHPLQLLVLQVRQYKHHHQQCSSSIVLEAGLIAAAVAAAAAGQAHLGFKGRLIVIEVAAAGVGVAVLLGRSWRHKKQQQQQLRPPPAAAVAQG